MPVKKRAVKKSKKKALKKQKEKKLKTEIKEAVEKIPGLFFERVEFQQPKPAITAPIAEPTKETEPKKSPKYDNNYREEKRKQLFVWTGVIILSIIIFSLWIWNTKTFFDVSAGQNSDFIKQTKQNINNIQQEKDAELKQLFPKDTQQKNLKENLKASLAQLLANFSTSAATTTAEITITTKKQ